MLRSIRSGRLWPTSFSALQRAENSSIYVLPALISHLRSFSALQRAENSSMLQALVLMQESR